MTWVCVCVCDMSGVSVVGHASGIAHTNAYATHTKPTLTQLSAYMMTSCGTHTQNTWHTHSGTRSSACVRPLRCVHIILICLSSHLPEPRAARASDASARMPTIVRLYAYAHVRARFDNRNRMLIKTCVPMCGVLTGQLVHAEQTIRGRSWRLCVCVLGARCSQLVLVFRNQKSAYACNGATPPLPVLQIRGGV